MRRRNVVALAVLVVAGAAILTLAYSPLRVFAGIRNLGIGRASVEDRVREYGAAAEARMRPRFEAAGVAYPPAAVALVVLKEERELRVIVPTEAGPREVARYRILAASGGPGPKLREGDNQVPEGFYGVESLNPNSVFHLALRVDYPNAEDLEAAAAEGRTRLGGDIMIHGKDASVGCVAIGDAPIEEIFVLVARAGIGNTEVVMAPSAQPRAADGAPAWIVERYEKLRKRLAELGVRSGV
jgi:hypothetical protein